LEGEIDPNYVEQLFRGHNRSSITLPFFTAGVQCAPFNISYPTDGTLDIRIYRSCQDAPRTYPPGIDLIAKARKARSRLGVAIIILCAVLCAVVLACVSGAKLYIKLIDYLL